VARSLPLIALVVVAAAPAVARAQSARYPADASDSDRETDDRSALWESALDPERVPYEQLVHDAKQALEEQTEHGWQLAVAKASDAIKRVPADPRAYGWRGEAYLGLRDWAHCADDLAASEAHGAAASSTLAAADRDRQEIELGVCQARAGRLADAERTLVHAAEHAPRGEAWLRLGEVRIALGKLDEAIDALTAALDTLEGRSATTHWLLAEAYDRARRPGPERGEPPATDGQLALATDAGLNTIEHPTYPWLGTAEHDYLMGLASSIAPVAGSARPEYALLYFRHFLAVATDSPWRARAEEHLRVLEAHDWPQYIERSTSSSAVIETSLLRVPIARAMPALHACVAKQPNDAYGVTLVKRGPQSADAADRPHVSLPQEGAAVELRLQVGDAAPAQLVESTRTCLQAIAARIALPTPKERDTWYKVDFIVIAP
jgi:tetratricopeptide (TPR) repeat protein